MLCRAFLVLVSHVKHTSFSRRLLFALVTGGVASIMVLSAPAQIISTVAGDGTAGYSGDGGSATGAEINYPLGVGADSVGNLYIADDQNCLVRKVSTTGVITTVAGYYVDDAGINSNCGYGGDGGPATSATLYSPTTVVADAAGNLYIADNVNCLIRKVTASTGIISTVAGNTNGAGIGSHSNCGYSGDGGPATSAKLSYSTGAAVDSGGNLYIADRDNCLIRKVAASTGIITTVAGITAGAGTQSNCGFSGDGGPATSAQISTYSGGGVATDLAGNYYIEDYDNCAVRKVNTSGVIETVAGTPNVGCGYSGDGGPATKAELSGTSSLAFDAAGNFYINQGDCLIRKVNTAGVISTVAGVTEGAGSGSNCGYNGDGIPATSSELDRPFGVATDSDGNLYIGDQYNQRIRKVPVLIRTSTTTSLTSSLNPSMVGETVTFTATVSPSGSPDPTGNVAFTSNGTVITGCSAEKLSSSLTATCATSSLAAGSDAIVATYSGDANYAPSSGALLQVVAAASATTVTSSLNPSMVGQSVTLTATVTPAGPPTPTGTVDFTSLGTTITGCSGVTLSSSRTATCTTSTLPVGTDAIVASYSGDSNYLSSMGTLAQLVNPSSTRFQRQCSSFP
ncbi:MAG: Ig-like domain repeat protein [Terriglobales bacterium]